MLQQIQQDAFNNYVGNRDTLIIETIKSLNGNVVVLTKNNCRWEVYPDKTEVFMYKNKPVIKFYPIEINYEGSKYTISQKYQLFNKQEECPTENPLDI